MLYVLFKSDIKIDDKVLSFKLLEGVNQQEYVNSSSGGYCKIECVEWV